MIYRCYDAENETLDDAEEIEAECPRDAAESHACCAGLDADCEMFVAVQDGETWKRFTVTGVAEVLYHVVEITNH